MEDDTKTGVSSRTERKALEKAKVLQRENERKTFKLVRPQRLHLEHECGLVSNH